MADEMTFMDPKEQLPVDEEPIGKSSAFEMIHWMNRQLKKYHDHPPKKLVKRIAEENDISIMEAERLIPQEVVIDFLVDELGEGSRRYGDMMVEPDPALMRKILLEIEADADK